MMTATEAREKLNLRNAKLTVKRAFVWIDKAIERGENNLDIYFGSSEGRLTNEEFKVLTTIYGYKSRAIYDDSGDYHKSDKLIGYTISW